MKTTKKEIAYILLQVTCVAIIVIMLLDKPIWVVLLGGLFAVLPGIIMRADIDYKKYIGE